MGQAPPPRIPVPKKVGRKWHYSTYQKKMQTFAILQQGLASENSVCRERSIKSWPSHNLAAGALSAANPPPDSSLRSMFLNLSPSMYFAQCFPGQKPRSPKGSCHPNGCCHEHRPPHQQHKGQERLCQTGQQLRSHINLQCTHAIVDHRSNDCRVERLGLHLGSFNDVVEEFLAHSELSTGLIPCLA